MTFREWLTFALHAARFNPDAADPKAAGMLEMVLKQYDDLSPDASAEGARVARLNGYLANIVADPDCCLASKEIARAGLIDRALSTPATDEWQHAIEAADLELLDAKMVLEGQSTNATGALATTEWRPDRAHIEGMRNTMIRALDGVTKARAALTVPLQGEGE